MTASAAPRLRWERLVTGPMALPASGVLATALVIANPGVPGLVPVAGLWLCIVLPTLLLAHKLAPRSAPFAEALIYGLATTLLALILGGLAMNQVLPLAGIDRPLDRVPALVAVVVALAGLVAWRFERRRALPTLAVSARESALLAASALVLLGAIGGATRLNNGASGDLTLAALALGGLVVVGLLVWRNVIDEGVVCGVLLLLGAALVLMTSLRGWYITGHDIQQEFRALGLTSGNGHWDVSLFREPYNACLSITILPTLIGRIAHLHDPYVLKVVIPLLFAVCPVLVYRIARRFLAVAPAVLSAVWFMAFPTFFTDMAFLARQEIAFIFLGAAFMVITDRSQSLVQRRVWLIIMAVGVIFSHYSTTYVLIGVMGIAWALSHAGPLVDRIRPARRRFLTIAREPLVITWPILVGLAVLVVLWTGPATGTSGQLEATVASSASGIFTGDLLGNRSDDVSYSLVAGGTLTPAERLAAYRANALEETAARRADGTYFPRDVIDRYATTPYEPPDLPLTALGRAVSDAGVDVTAANALMRGGFARLLQLFVLIGLVVAALGLVRWFRATHEFFLLAVASFLAIISQVLLPALTVEYGLLRAVQQGLFVLAPFLVAGSIAPFVKLGLRRATAVASALGVCFFLSLTGVLPSMLGGYPAQLHLSNSGVYYDLYYVQPQEQAAIAWLAARSGPGTEVQSERQNDRYESSNVADFASFSISDDIYPVYLRPDSIVFLGESVVQRGHASLPAGSDRLNYRYPLGLLDDTKDLIYSSTGGLVYAPPPAATSDARQGTP